MKLAMPYSEGRINEHFGMSREFVIFDLVEGKIAEKKIISNSGLQHNHSGIAGLFVSEGVEVVIAGGMGPPMANALRGIGLQVLTGASGEVEKVAADYLSGHLVTGSEGCNHGCSGHAHTL